MEAQTWIGLATAARQLDGNKISNETAEIAAIEAMQTRIGGYGNISSSGRRREIGVTIAA